MKHGHVALPDPEYKQSVPRVQPRMPEAPTRMCTQSMPAEMPPVLRVQQTLAAAPTTAYVPRVGPTRPEGNTTTGKRATKQRQLR